jgi:hypothetical protein
MASQIGQRLAFQNAANAVKRAGQNPANAVLSQSYLRLETALVQGNTQYKFDVLVNENTQTTNFNTQLKLNLQDSFIVSQIGFFLAAPSSTTDASFRLLTYPNKTAFGTPSALNTIYNGFMSLTINQRTIIPNWDLYKHLDVPQTQQNQIQGTYSGAVTSPGVLPDDMNNAGDFGFFPCEPNIVLVGSKKNDLTVTLPGTGLSAVTANSRLVCIFRGILAQNSTSVN